GKVEKMHSMAHSHQVQALDLFDSPELLLPPLGVAAQSLDHNSPAVDLKCSEVDSLTAVQEIVQKIFETEGPPYTPPVPTPE
ncbi:hypothetical protein L9F63_025268, partial [Diploptera punctata]